MSTQPPTNPTQPPYRWLFLDLNSYFASCEQQARPELRGMPVAVAPILADSGTCIAASYPAKKFGVKRGTRVSEARQLCPGIIILPANMPLYTEYHQKIVAAMEKVTIVTAIRSIDEMAIRLDPSEQNEPAARKLAAALKQSILKNAGEALTCSIGVSSNDFLAKMAADLQKPDGLTFISPAEVPKRLLALKLTDFPGISTNMERRLHERGITTVAEMYAADEGRLRAVWGGVGGARWYHLIRGEEVILPATQRRSVGHSNVLPPEVRTEAGARAVLLRLIQKAAARLRSMEYRAKAMQVYVQGRGHNWEASARFDAASDPLTFIDVFQRLWAKQDFSSPIIVGVTFSELIPDSQVSQSPFTEVNSRAALGRALDAINNRFGKNSIYIAAGHEAIDTAEEKIAFLKTKLFQEGASPDQRLKDNAARWREKRLQ